MLFLLVMTTSATEKIDGLKALEVAIEKIKETINKLGGVFNIQMAVSAYFKVMILNRFYILVN